ncbi:hypothetical protein [Brevundimonas naejangsanensis]|uniref:hypothetical protein n=1 Tax=Brevundimonas naejangsanensis TaxID=588932 RepID=UPI0034D62D84
MSGVVDFEHERASRTMTWTPTSQALPEIGLVVRIKCGDGLGSYDVPGRHFLHEDGQFYGIEPPTVVVAKVTHWVMG